MIRYSLTLVTILGLASAAPAASWAERLFEVVTHDFGAVPRGPTVSGAFRLNNTTGQPLRIASVRVSCGCLRASASRTELAPGESAAIAVEMDTRRFTGVWRKDVFVVFDQPQVAEVRLAVQANSRDDVVVTPEALAFGRVRAGASPHASVTLTVFNSGMQVRGAKAESPYLRATVERLPADSAEVSYRVTAHVWPDLPTGSWYTTVWLATDNPAAPRLAIPVTVEVVP